MTFTSSFDSAVGLGPSGAGALLVVDTGFGQRGGEIGRVDVLEGVVGHHPPDGDAVVGEEGRGTPPEGSAGGAGVVGEGMA